MDVGVGSFVFSQGLAASSSTTPAKLGKTLKKCVPVVGLGMIRVIMVKGVDYPVRRFHHPFPEIISAD